MITQNDLQTLINLRTASNEYKACREKLLRRFLAGDSVEPGPLLARVDESESRVFTRSKLAALLGEEVIAGLAKSIEPTVYRTIVVEARYSGSPTPSGNRTPLHNSTGRQFP
jgi:hypothetical protein